MAVTSSTSTTPFSATKTPDSTKQGFNGLTADDFFKLLVAQLQNQDPSEPVSNEQLLQQISTIRGLQSDIEMGTVLKNLTEAIGGTAGIAGERLSVAASFLGKQVTLPEDGFGTVDRAFMREGQAFVSVNNKDITVGDIQAVVPPTGLVDQMVSAKVVTNGVPTSVVGYVTEVFLHEETGEVTANVAQASDEPRDKGKLVNKFEVPVKDISHLYTYDSFVGKTALARDASGNQVRGLVAETLQLINNRPAYLVGGAAVPATNIIALVQ